MDFYKNSGTITMFPWQDPIGRTLGLISININVIFMQQMVNGEEVPYCLKVWAVAQLTSLLFFYKMEIYSSGELFTKQ